MTLSFIKRLKKNYSKTQKTLTSNEIGYHWSFVNKRKQLFNKKKLNNFLNNDLGYGLSRKDAKINKKNLLNVCIKKNKHFTLKRLTKKNIGNFKNPLIYKKRFCNNNNLHYIDWLLEVNKYIKKEKIKNILEIGGGYGGLSQILINNLNAKYFLIDLPETNVLSSFFLKKSFPKKNFLFSEEFNFKNTEEIIKKNDIFILTPDKLNNLNLNFDLIINTRSMMEMKKKTIQVYFDYIQNNISKNGIFLNINRYFSYHSGEQNFLSNYPYDENWKILKSQPTNFEKHIHLFLTKRINYKNKNLKKELRKLKLKEFEPSLIQIIKNIKKKFFSRQYNV